MRAACLLSLILAILPQSVRAEDDERVRDEQTLREADLTWDGPALLRYFRQRTPTDEQRKAILSLIEQLGDGSFRVREKATKTLTTYGLTAIGPLKQGRANPDPEIANRCAKCLERLEKVPSGLLTAAVARMVARIKPDGGLDAVLSYLPQADDETAADGLRW